MKMKKKLTKNRTVFVQFKAEKDVIDVIVSDNQTHRKRNENNKNKRFIFLR